MSILSGAISDAEQLLSKGLDIIEANPLTSAAVGGTVGAAAIGGAIALGSNSKRKKRRKSSRSRDRKFISRAEVKRGRRKTAGKVYKRKGKYRVRNHRLVKVRRRKSKIYGRRKSRGRVHIARNGARYIILANGRARFVKRKSRR